MRAVIYGGTVFMAMALGLSAAHADFCLWNARAVADAALPSLTPGATIQSYCPTCADKAATSEVVKTAVVEKVPDQKDEYYHVMVNGHAIDLAYTFVAAQGAGWADLGYLAKCSDDSDLLKMLPDSVPVK